jgi:hypothetical protein
MRVAETLAIITPGLSQVSAERTTHGSELGTSVGVSARFTTQQIYRDTGVLLACDAELVNGSELPEAVGLLADQTR